MFQSDFHSAMRTVKRREAPHRDDSIQRKQRDFQHCKNNSTEHMRPSQWLYVNSAFYSLILPDYLCLISSQQYSF